MMKTMIKWDFTDDYGRADEKDARIKWFDTEVEAEAWKAKMKENNGGFFKVWTTKKADYEKYIKMIKLEKRLEELKKEF